MPAPTPPTPIASVPPTPDRNEGEIIFVPKMFTFLDYFQTLKGYMDSVVSYCSEAITWVAGLVSTVDAKAAEAAASATSANASANRSESAAAAAEQAAGLTPDPNFGMVISTTANTEVKTATFTAIVGRVQDVDTSGGAFAIATPASPTYGQWIGVRDINQQAFNGIFPWFAYASDRIIGKQENCFIDVNTIILTWRGAAKGWCV